VQLALYLSQWLRSLQNRSEATASTRPIAHNGASRMKGVLCA